jgi:EmrB/QacA subfamily drug resistance transporter
MTAFFPRLRGQIAIHPSRKWLILSTVLLGATMSALDLSIVSVAMPTLKTTFATSMATIEWVAMAYMLALTVFLPLFGRLADMYGRTRLYNIGFIIFSVGSLFCGLSTSAAMLIASRTIQAVGAGMLQANSIGIITHAFPAKERGKAIGIQGAVQAVSMAIAPVLGGVLITAVGWRAIFYLNIPIGIVGTVAALLILPKCERKPKEKIDYLGAALFASGLAGLLLALNEAVKLGWESHTIIAYLVSGVVLLSLFIYTELKVKHPLIDLGLFKNSTFLLGNISGMLSYYVLFAVMFLMPFYLERVKGYGATLTGLLLTPLLLAMAVSAPLSGRISDKYGSRIMTTAGMLVSAAGCLWLLYLGGSARITGVIGTMIFLGIGMGLFSTSNNTAIMSAAPSEKLGMAGGLLNMTRSLGLIFGVNVSGMVFTTLEHGYLAQNGFPNSTRIFSNSNIPVPLKADAFMHGFMMVIIILLAVNILAAVLSAMKKGPAAGIIDHEASGAVILSSGFLSGFNQETAGMAAFVLVLLLAGYVGAFAFSRPRIGGGPFAEQGAAASGGPAAVCTRAMAPQLSALALGYYVQKHHDKNVSVVLVPSGNHVEADIRKNGLLVAKLSIKDGKIAERRTGLKEWVFEELMLVN